MEKLLAILSTITFTLSPVTTVAGCWNTKLKQIDLEKYLAIVKQEANRKHLVIEEAIKQIQTISELPEGVSKTSVSNSNINEIKISFEVLKGYDDLLDVNLKFFPIKTISIDKFKNKVKNLVENRFKTINEAKDEIVKLSAPMGVISFNVAIKDQKITISFKVKTGYMSLPNLVFDFLPIKNADTSIFESEVNKIVNRQFKTITEALEKIKRLSLPVGVKSILITKFETTITISFKMNQGYENIPIQNYQFLPLQDANLSAFDAEVNKIVNKPSESVDPE